MQAPSQGNFAIGHEKIAYFLPIFWLMCRPGFYRNLASVKPLFDLGCDQQTTNVSDSNAKFKNVSQKTDCQSMQLVTFDFCLTALPPT